MSFIKTDIWQNTMHSKKISTNTATGNDVSDNSDNDVNAEVALQCVNETIHVSRWFVVTILLRLLFAINLDLNEVVVGGCSCCWSLISKNDTSSLINVFTNVLITGGTHMR